MENEDEEALCSHSFELLFVCDCVLWYWFIHLPRIKQSIDAIFRFFGNVCGRCTYHLILELHTHTHIQTQTNSGLFSVRALQDSVGSHLIMRSNYPYSEQSYGRLPYPYPTTYIFLFNCWFCFLSFPLRGARYLCFENKRTEL